MIPSSSITRNIIKRNRWQTKKEKELVLNIIYNLLRYRMACMQEVHTGSKRSWAFLPRIQPSTAIKFKAIATISRNLWVTNCWRLSVSKESTAPCFAMPIPSLVQPLLTLTCLSRGAESDGYWIWLVTAICMHHFYHHAKVLHIWFGFVHQCVYE